VAIIWVLTGTLTLSSIRLDLAGGFRYVAFLCIAIAALAKAGACLSIPGFRIAARSPRFRRGIFTGFPDKLLGIYLLGPADHGPVCDEHGHEHAPDARRRGNDHLCRDDGPGSA